MNGVAQIIGCLLMYGIGKNTSATIAPWRILFLICGALTSIAGVVFYIFMPNGPRDAWFLSTRQKQVLSLRMVQDREGGDKTDFSTAQLKEALLDPKSWFVFAFGVLVTMQSPVLTVSVGPVPLKDPGQSAKRTIVRFAGHQQHRLRQIPDHALHSSLRRGPDRHALDRCAGMRSAAAKSDADCSRPDYPRSGRQHLSSQAVSQRRLGYDRRIVASIMHHSAMVNFDFPHSRMQTFPG